MWSSIHGISRRCWCAQTAMITAYPRDSRASGCMGGVVGFRLAQLPVLSPWRTSCRLRDADSVPSERQLPRRVGEDYPDGLRAVGEEA